MIVYRNDGLFDDNFRVFRKKTRKCLVVSQKMTTFAPAIQMVPVVQLVRASDCGSECRVITFFVSIFGYQIHFWK